MSGAWGSGGCGEKDAETPTRELARFFSLLQQVGSAGTRKQRNATTVSEDGLCCLE